jgi:hypothetical protein
VPWWNFLLWSFYGFDLWAGTPEVIERSAWQKNNSAGLTSVVTAAVAIQHRPLFESKRSYIMFNKKQRDGLAKVFDTVGTALLVALGVNIIVNQSLDWLQAVALAVTGVTCVAVALVLRK